MKTTTKRTKYYTKKQLVLRPDVPGARRWAVALKKAMLTYFEIQPRSVFPPHSHASEQITMVLRGTLYFKVKRTVTAVRQGEVIAVPSSVSHAVFTKERAVIAIDAWSPIRREYLVDK